MKYFKNDVASFYYNETVLPSVINLCNLIKEYPFILKPFRGDDEQVKNILLKRQDTINLQITNHLSDLFERIPLFSIEGFYLFPTVEKTTLLYDEKSDFFIKIIHPLTFKNEVFSIFTNRARSVYFLSENLLSKAIKVPKIIAYGMFRKGRSSFYVMERIEGKSLHNLLINEKKNLPNDIYLKTIDKVAELHRLGYWFGDLRISHVFVEHGDISGFIDIDSIRRNWPFRLKNLAKDLAGLNRPNLPLCYDEKRTLFKHYVKKLGIKREEHLLKLIKYYTKRRWKL